MSKSISFWEHPVEKLEEALAIRKQIAALQTRLSGLFGNEEPPASKTTTKRSGKTGKRTMSTEARARIAAAQRARWAKTKGESAASNPATPKTSKPAKKAKRNISPEGRARMAAAAKKRWAAKKAA